MGDNPHFRYNFKKNRKWPLRVIVKINLFLMNGLFYKRPEHIDNFTPE